MTTDVPFDAWRESDLLQFLRTFARLTDSRSRVSAADVQAELNIDDATATNALQRLRDIGCLADHPGPKRMGDGLLSTDRILTAAGTRAVMRNELPL